jgi:hypothetical protein
MRAGARGISYRVAQLTLHRVDRESFRQEHDGLRGRHSRQGVRERNDRPNRAQARLLQFVREEVRLLKDTFGRVLAEAFIRFLLARTRDDVLERRRIFVSADPKDLEFVLKPRPFHGHVHSKTGQIARHLECRHVRA